MEKNNLKRMKSDPKIVQAQAALRLCYVDDLMLFGSQPDVQAAISDLSKDLILKVTGHLTDGKEVTFLDRNIKRRDNSFELYMSDTYIKNLLNELELENAKPAVTPGTETWKTKGVAEPLDAEQRKKYRRLVGQLLWLRNVRCDIMSRGLNASTADHWARLRHFGRYLVGTGHFVQHLRPTVKLHDKNKALDTNTYVDLDWAGCHDTRRSTSGVALFVLGVSLLSHSRMQATVTFSSGEAELYAIGSGT